MSLSLARPIEAVSFDRLKTRVRPSASDRTWSMEWGNYRWSGESLSPQHESDAHRLSRGHGSGGRARRLIRPSVHRLGRRLGETQGQPAHDLDVRHGSVRVDRHFE